MIRRLVCALFIVGLGVSFALADEIRATITKIDGKNVTFYENKGKGEKGDTKTLPVADNVKVVKGKFNKDTKKTEAGDALEGGLKNEALSKIGEKGVGATVVTSADNKSIVEIRVTGGQKKKGK